jgi:hypothetical protein
VDGHAAGERERDVRQLFFVVIGLVVGFVLAGRIGREPGLLHRVDDVAKGFTTAVADGYRSRDAELRAADHDV